MIDTIFSDYIVSATDLRNNQRHWLEKAYNSPVTVNYGRRQLAIINREQVNKLYITNHYTELVLRACQEFDMEGKSEIFPWIETLSDDEKISFHKELLSCTIKSIVNGNWTQLENLIQDWKATAEVEKNTELAEALLASEDPSQYIEINE